MILNVLLTNLPASQNEAVFSYSSVRGHYFLAVTFAAIIIANRRKIIAA